MNAISCLSNFVPIKEIKSYKFLNPNNHLSHFILINYIRIFHLYYYI